MATGPLMSSGADGKQNINTYMNHAWSGWGQIRKVEDSFRCCRYREQSDTTNMTCSMTSYDVSMANIGVVGLHQRDEVTFDHDEPVALGKAHVLFTAGFTLHVLTMPMMSQGRRRGRHTLMSLKVDPLALKDI